jgi:hypothetical protein
MVFSELSLPTLAENLRTKFSAGKFRVENPPQLSSCRNYSSNAAKSKEERFGFILRKFLKRKAFEEKWQKDVSRKN